MAYTIKEIADLAGVTTRTLRYYDEIGLLPPAGVGENGYRTYDRASLLRLQQILFFRELDVPLKEIERMLSRPDFDALEALERHRAALRKRARAWQDGVRRWPMVRWSGWYLTGGNPPGGGVLQRVR